MDIAVNAHHSMIADQIELCSYFVICKIGSGGKISTEKVLLEKNFDINEIVKMLLINNVKAVIVNQIEDSTYDTFRANDICVIQGCKGEMYDTIEKLISEGIISAPGTEIILDDKVS